MNKQILRKIILTGLFALPFIPFLVYGEFFFPFITTKAFAFRIIVEIIFSAWVLLALVDPQYRPRKSLIFYCLFIFIGIIGLADILGMAPVKSFWSNFERMEGYITLLHLGALFLVMGSVFRETHADGGASWRRWWNTSLFASFIMIIYCLFQLAGTLAINQGGVRVDGTLGNASYLAVYMLFHIFVALYLMCQTRKNHILRWTYVALIILQTFILYHTATRGAILGLLGGLLVISFLNLKNKEDKKMRKISIAALILIAVLAGGFWLVRNSEFVHQSPVLARFTSISAEEFKSGGRSFVWPMALKGVAEKPILGWGQDNFNYVFNKHYQPEMYHLEPWFDRAHNIFLDWAVAGGLLGLLAYLSLYAALLYLIWKRDGNFSFTEKTVLTGLLVGYFLHNLFVFDHLISYILFFAFLAYIHSQSEGKQSSFSVIERVSSETVGRVALPVITVLVILVIYFVNISPVVTNANLINALVAAQTQGSMSVAINSFDQAYNGSRLGRPEVVEQIARLSPNILSGELSMEEKNTFFNLANEAVIRQADILQTDARYQLLTGSFLSTFSLSDEGLKYLERAKELSPGKQQIYFEIGAVLINKGDLTGALKEFKDAYNLAPNNSEAKIIYLIGAIYAKDRELEAKLLKELPETILITDRRILSAYVVNKRNSEAISILRQMGEIDSNLKPQIDEYIKQILNGQ